MRDADPPRTGSRRRFLHTMAGGASALCAPIARRAKAEAHPAKRRRQPRVVVVGGGWGGATAARYLRLWSGGAIEVILIERDERFVSCPLSNLVLSGLRSLEQLSFSYDGLRRLGVRVVRGEAERIDPERALVRTAAGEELQYDRLIVAPGLDLQYDAILGYDASARERIVAAWSAGAETLALRRQLESMPDGGVMIIAIPLAPYRCPPSPYERACQAALFLKRRGNRAKVLILDANEAIVSKPVLFGAAFKEFYADIIDYQPNNEVKEVDVKAMVVKTDFDTFKGDVLNVLPPMRAGRIAMEAGLVTANARWCGVQWASMESTARAGIHVLGDATLAANLMPKSGHMANQHAKIAASAIVADLLGQDRPRELVIANACYSWTSDRHVIHVASVHRYDPAARDMLPVPGAGGLSSANSEAERPYAEAWASGMWADMLAG